MAGRMKLLTKNGHSLFDIASLLQKSIRRGDERWAGYAVNELRGRYNTYLWKRLLIISAEDCWGIITKEIMALQQADEYFNKGKSGYDRNGEFLSKATTLLLKAYKNRDSDWFACNLIQSEETLDIKSYLNLEETDTFVKENLPEYAYDCHTLVGKRKGLTKHDMIRDEQEALFPKIKGDFDDRDWDNFHEAFAQIKKDNFNKDNKFPHPTREELKKLEDDQRSLF